MLIVAAVAGFLVFASVPWWGPLREGAEALFRPSPVDRAAAMLVGRWRWNGIRCGEGPEVTRAGDKLVFSMDGAPRYVHDVLIEEMEYRVSTRLVEPAEMRDATFQFDRVGEEMSVGTFPSEGPSGLFYIASGWMVDHPHWVRCA